MKNKPRTMPVVNENNVTFYCEAAKAAMVNVLGSFNHWDLTDGVMYKNSSGRWEKTFEVPLLGSYDYKFIIDGQWTIDPCNPDYGKDEKGRYNSRFMIHTSEAARRRLDEFSACLDQHPPGVPASERVPLFDVADRILQLPTAAHSRAVREHFFSRFSQMLDKLKERTARSITSTYCHGYVYAQSGLAIGIDVVTTRSVWGLYWDIPDDMVERCADSLDVLCVSHLHPDHFDYHLMARMLERKKDVFVPAELVDRFPAGAIPVESDTPVEWNGWRIYFHSGRHVYDERQMLVLKMIEIVSPEAYRIVHTSDHDYSQGVKTTGKVNLLIAKAGGISPVVPAHIAFRNLVLHTEPDHFIAGHLNELGHPVRGGREPYRMGWDYVLANSSEKMGRGEVLHWGEQWFL